MHVEHNYHRNMLEMNFQLLSYPTHSLKQKIWRTPEQEAYGVYYTIPKCNYYLQGADIIVHNDHKPLAKFLNERMTITRSTDGDWNLWPTISLLSGYQEHETKLPTASPDWLNYQNNREATVKMLTATNSDRPAFNTRIKMSHQCQTTRHRYTTHQEKC